MLLLCSTKGGRARCAAAEASRPALHGHPPPIANPTQPSRARSCQVGLMTDHLRDGKYKRYDQVPDPYYGEWGGAPATIPLLPQPPSSLHTLAPGPPRLSRCACCAPRHLLPRGGGLLTGPWPLPLQAGTPVLSWCWTCWRTPAGGCWKISRRSGQGRGSCSCSGLGGWASAGARRTLIICHSVHNGCTLSVAFL